MMRRQAGNSGAGIKTYRIDDSVLNFNYYEHWSLTAVHITFGTNQNFPKTFEVVINIFDRAVNLSVQLVLTFSTASLISFNTLGL